MKTILYTFLLLLAVSSAFAARTSSRISGAPAAPAQAAVDTTAPVITVTSPDVTRALKAVAKTSAVTVAGKAESRNGVAQVTVNGKQAALDEKGNFSAEMLLKIGENSFTVTALDVNGNQSAKTFTINRTADSKVAAAPEKAKQSVAPVATGAYHALIIGNNAYRNITPLKTAVRDAQEVERTLKEQFGFKTTLVTNGTRKEILSTLNGYSRKLGENDSLLVYYAGHGEFEKTAGKAYWLPVDAQRDDPTEWIIADDITSGIKRIPSKHVLIVSDSCYSGTLDRSINIDLTGKGERSEMLRKMLDRPSRTLMSSGGNEPVADGGGKGHSIFADSFLGALRTFEEQVFTAEELFHRQIKSRVAGKSDQVPEYKQIRNSGDEGGDFVFVRKP